MQSEEEILKLHKKIDNAIRNIQSKQLEAVNKSLRFKITLDKLKQLDQEFETKFNQISHYLNELKLIKITKDGNLKNGNIYESNFEKKFVNVVNAYNKVNNFQHLAQ